MFRRATLLITLAIAVPVVAVTHAQPPAGFELEEATIQQMQEWMSSGRYTSRRLTELYLQRITDVDRSGPALRSISETNPDALAIADALDAERRAKRVHGPLHGIPIVIKDNIDTGDTMTTTAGSLALEGSIATRDAFVIERLRAAGAVIIAKTNLSEWANFRSTKSSSGSSSGSGAAVAANLAAAAVGTETDGSIVCPAGANGLVGLKPTVGLVSRSGIIPISHTQDTAGPMARTVADAAALLTGMTGVDPRDAATKASRPADYLKALDAGALKGARIGVARKQYFGYSPATDRAIDAAIAHMKSAGAIIVDPADVSTAAQLDDCEMQILTHEFKDGLNKYLAQLPPSVTVRTLADIIAFNEREAAREMPFFGQELLLLSQKKGPLTTPAYRQALATCRTRSRTLGIDAVMQRHRLDALVAPTGSPAWTTDLVNGDHFLGASSTPAAVAGYPSITVPAGHVQGLPIGISFIGRAWSEARLLALAYAYEQGTKHRRPPSFRPTLLP
jgi:amidase